MKRVIAVAGVVALLLVGCKSSSDSSSNGAKPASTELGQGVTDDTIKLGITYTDLSALKEIMKLDHGDYKANFQAYADWVNEQGGINGRKLAITDAPVSPIGTTAGTAACVKLAEDQKVFAVVGDPQSDIVPCYVTDHQTAVVGGWMSEEGLSTAKAPWFTWKPTLDHLAAKTVEGAAAKGVFNGKKVGIVTTAMYQPVVDASVKPALDAANVKIVDTGVIDVPADDQAAATTAAKTIAEKFKSEGIEVVISVAQTFSTWANGVIQTDYRPIQVPTDSNTVAAWIVLKDASQLSILDGAYSGAGAPSDVWWNTAPMKECVTELQKRTGTTITSPVGYVNGSDAPQPYVSAQIVCSTMSIFTAIAKKAGKTLNNDTFLAAGHALGVFLVPGNGGDSNYTATDPSGAPPVYLATWDAAKKELVSPSTPIK